MNVRNDRNWGRELFRKVIAHIFGPRTKKALMRLMALLAPFNMVVLN
ncbi:IS1 family transposase [Xenorhabdus doucetiae]